MRGRPSTEASGKVPRPAEQDQPQPDPALLAVCGERPAVRSLCPGVRKPFGPEETHPEV